MYTYRLTQFENLVNYDKSKTNMNYTLNYGGLRTL